MTEFSWIRTEVKRLFPNADLTKGVDLDNNGTLEDNEKITDADGNGVIGNHADWEAFRKRNDTVLRALPSVFKYGAAFKPDNPLHDVMAIEAPHIDKSDIERLYTYASKVLTQLKNDIKTKTQSESSNPLHPALREFVTPSVNTPRGKLEALYGAMKTFGLKYNKGNSSPLLAHAARANMFVCLSLSLFALGVAHEMGWPTHLVLGPSHAFTRWDDGKGTKVNMDQGAHKTDGEYIKDLRINPLAVTRKGYLATLSRNEMIATSLYLRIQYKSILHKAREAVDDAKAAVALHPTSPYANEALGTTLTSSGRYTEALAAYDKALYYDPNSASVHYFKGLIHQVKGESDKATEEFNKAKALDPTESYKSQIVKRP